MPYRLYLTETVEGEAHPTEVAHLSSGLEIGTAAEIAVRLQRYLRDGVEAHFGSEEDEA